MSEETNHISTFRRVLRRELNRMTSRRIYFGTAIVLPLFTLFFMATIFGSGEMENLPVGIVDLDNSATSRSLTRTIEAVPTLLVTRHFVDEYEARQSVQNKEIYGYLVIPHNFEQNSVTGKGAVLSYYYHYALLAVGGEVMAAFETTLKPIEVTPIAMEAVELGVNTDEIETFLLPILASDHPVYNPALNYSIYLSQSFFYVLFQILVLLVTLYVVGSEIKFKTANEWLDCANGNILIAIIAKVLPYTIIFCIEGVFANYIMFNVIHLPFNGSWLMLNLSSILFILATQSLSLFVFSIFPAIAIIISIVSMLGSLGATLSGITFPVDNMYPLVHDISYLLPIRHYTEIVQTMLYTNGDYQYYWPSLVVFFIFPILALLLLPRLRKAIISRKYEDFE